MERIRLLLRQRRVQQLLKIVGLLLSITLGLMLFVQLVIPAILSIDWPDWTGFNTYTKSDGTVEREKTLWDWMQLLIIPLVLAIGGYWFNRTEKKAEQVQANERAKIEREVAADNQREEALQAYLDRMSELLIDKDLRNTPEESEERVTARARTLTVLRRLDPTRKGAVLQFLYESQLIKKDDTIVNLDEADLEGADLQRAHLSQANLSGANLPRADLGGADLEGTNLSHADLEGADLGGTGLERADLQRANLLQANLNWAKLQGADLRHAYLNKANLVGAKLQGADLRQAYLNEANLVGADLQGARCEDPFINRGSIDEEVKYQLAVCWHLNGATLPDGTKVPNDVDNPFHSLAQRSHVL